MREYGDQERLALSVRFSKEKRERLGEGSR